MLRFIFTKIKNKYKLYLALLAGTISMIAVFGVIMMLRKGSLDRLILSEFQSSYEAEGIYPARISRTGTYLPQEGVGVADGTMETIQAYEESWDQYLELPVVNSQSILWMKGRRAIFSYRGDSSYLDLGYMEGGYGNDHFQLLDGVYPDEAEVLPEGHFPCLIDRHTMDVNHFVVGETLTMKELAGPEDEPVVFHIVGVIRENGISDHFWQKSLAENGQMIYLRKDDFNRIAAEHDLKKVLYETFRVYDYRRITAENAGLVSGYLKQFHEQDESLIENLTPSLMAADQKSVSVKAVLYAISIPLLMLVIIFISMIAVRIISSEQGEIAMLHSRGTSRMRILLIYAVQSLILAVISFGPGLLLGYGAGRAMASATGFLTFTNETVAGYGIYPGMVIVSGLAALLATVIMLIPVIPGSRSTVVEQKKRKHAEGIPLWEKFFLDIVLLGVSVYLLFNFTRQLDQLKLSVLAGEGIDPMIFLTSTFFLIAMGLLILRLVSYLVRLIFRLGKKRFSPAVYAAFLQIIRTRRGSGVISVFLVLTIAMSIFNANMARTVSANQEERIAYNIGCDMVLQENWQVRVLSQDHPMRWMYFEPDYAVFENLVKDGLAESVTRVIRDDQTTISLGKKGQETGTLLAVNTKEFGETARLMEGLTEEHWYTYLNALSQVTNGILISRNLAEKYELSEGDTLSYSRFSPVEPEYTYASSSGKIVGIVDAFPGYETCEYIYNEEGKLTERERFLIVANYTGVVGTFERTPYSVWVKTDRSAEEIRNAVTENMSASGRSLSSVRSLKEEIREMQDSSMIKITNGLFTLNVLVALLLCVLGYLIHWITSIRDRELLFGIYRAMGISMREVSRMLSLEQLFLSLGPFAAGIGAGTVATFLFSKLFAVVYLPEKHAVPLEMYTSAADFLRLTLIIGGSMLLCYIIIHRIVRRMKITDALKLGED